MNETVYIETKHKDTLFRMLFKEKTRLLELYNAINNTAYDDPEELEVVTLENAVYLSMKNDISCLVDMRIQLYEQQSTVNPNMPLRDLMYVCTQYEKLIVKKDLYSRRLIRLPTPKFVVFYNGVEKQPEQLELYLSDAFEIPEESPALELCVTQYNINEGFNKELLDKCPTLFHYMQYVSLVREYRKTMSLPEAVSKAVNYCIANGILEDFLLANKAEVMKMTIFEYDEEQHKQTLLSEGYEDGFNDGFSDGFSNGNLSTLITLICRKLKKGKSPEIIANELEEDFDVIQHLCSIAKNYAPDYDVKEIVNKAKQINELNR